MEEHIAIHVMQNVKVYKLHVIENVHVQLHQHAFVQQYWTPFVAKMEIHMQMHVEHNVQV